MNTWPELIRSIQGERTQRQFAADLGITEGAVCHWIKGRRKPDEGQRRVLYALGTEEQRTAMIKLSLA